MIAVCQTGKTWIIKKFCQETYKDYVYINLEEQDDMRSVFDGNLDPDTVIRGIEQMLERKIGTDIPIFLDEIQTCERAITSLKYFCEDSRDFRIICAGSLLGVKIHRFESSFPVGKVEIEYMYPMDFEEFLIACDEDILKDGIREAYNQKNRMPSCSSQDDTLIGYLTMFILLWHHSYHGVTILNPPVLCCLQCKLCQLITVSGLPTNYMTFSQK